MSGNFDTCLKAILREEGGNDDDPHDHGGRTSRGVTQREYDAYRSRHGLPPADVWNAGSQEIADIYLKQYWNPYCGEIPVGLDLMFFDCAVNAGRTQAIKDLQRALNVKVDGMFGMLTSNAINDCTDLPSLIKAYAERRRAFYRALKQFPRYGKGWLARVGRIEAQALAMCNKTPSPSTATVRVAKASPEDVDQATVPPEGGAMISGGGATAAGAVNQLKDQLEPWANTIQWVQYILIAIALVGVGLTIWAIIKNRRAKQVV